MYNTIVFKFVVYNTKLFRLIETFLNENLMVP